MAEPPRSPLAPRNDGNQSSVKFDESASKSRYGSYFHPTQSSFSVFSGSKMPSSILAEDLIMKGAKRKPLLGQSINEFYASITHLHFQSMRIVGDVEPLRLCINLRVLYLYENRLTSLKGIGQLRRLTHLYAQDNRIEDLSDFEAPPSLSQLFLGGNRLTLIEGLEGCQSLTELHVECQQPIPADQIGALRIAEESASESGESESVPGSDAGADASPKDAGAEAGGSAAPAAAAPAGFSISMPSLVAIAPTLRKLVIHRNAIDDDALEPIIVLQSLTSLDVRHNALESIARLQQFVVRLPQLTALQLTGNPLTMATKCRERIIVATHGLSELDGKPIKDSERAFLLSLAQRQSSAPSKRVPLEQRAPSGHQASNERTMGVGKATSGEAREQRRAYNARVLATQGPQQLGVSIPSAQSYHLGRGHGVVGELPSGFHESLAGSAERGNSAGLPSGTRRPWARAPHAA